jgi:hypothetical protein
MLALQQLMALRLMLTHLGKHLILVSPHCACADALSNPNMFKANHNYDAEDEMSAMQNASDLLPPDVHLIWHTVRDCNLPQMNRTSTSTLIQFGQNSILLVDFLSYFYCYQSFQITKTAISNYG